MRFARSGSNALVGLGTVLVTLEPASLRGEVAQLVEHTAENRGVAGSIPALAIFPAGYATGSSNENAEPRPGFDTTQMRPPICWTSFRQM